MCQNKRDLRIDNLKRKSRLNPSWKTRLTCRLYSLSLLRFKNFAKVVYQTVRKTQVKMRAIGEILSLFFFDTGTEIPISC
jgi:hypothetical protein